jgi:hypothetical protein
MAARGPQELPAILPAIALRVRAMPRRFRA